MKEERKRRIGTCRRTEGRKVGRREGEERESKKGEERKERR